VEELNQLNSDMENLFTCSEIATIFLDRKLTIKRFSPAMAAIFNLIPADIGRPFRHLAGTIDWSDLPRDAESVLKKLSTVEREVTTLEDGRHFLMRVLPYRTTEGSIDGIVVTLVDISEVKRLEERTRHLASFPQLNPNPIIEVDSAGKIAFFNPATGKVLRILGLDEVNVEVFLPPDLDSILKNWDRQSEATIHREIAIKEKVFGETIFLTPLFDSARIYAFDITERKWGEQALLRAKEEWERTFDSVPDLIAIMDDQHRIMRVNKAMADRMGVTPQECAGQVCYRSVHDADQPPLFCPHSMTAEDGRGHEAEVHEERLGGDFLVTTTPLLDGCGQMIGSVHVARDITERKRAEEALRESETRVRRKLDSILLPEGDIGNLDLADIIDAKPMQSLMDNFYKLARVPMGMIDLKGKVLVGVGWQDVCTKFHRTHPEACKNCIESDTLLSSGVPQGEYKLYKCKNNMWDVATPIMIGGKHFGNLFMGQFLFEDEPLDYEFFRSQAKQYGFDEKEYIAALESVPRFSKEFLHSGMAYFMELAEIISKLSYSNIKLARSLAERDDLMESLRENNEELTRFNDASVGRELRMIELKKEINGLCAKAGVVPPYRVNFE
jgi:PAS domain S-box-containing protein